MGHEAKLSTESIDVGRDLFDQNDDEQDLEKRAPVVTIMGSR